MILCHKCAGLLSNLESENVDDLRSCECISGWVRGFESDLNREQAIQEQANQQERWADLYTIQGRRQDMIDFRLKERDRLLALLK